MSVVNRSFYGFAVLILLTACSGCTPVHRGKADKEVRSVPDTLTIQEPKVVFQPDSAAVAAAFSLLAGTASFKQKTEEDGASVYDPDSAPLIGDINHDGLPDALKPFSIEGRGGGNNWTAHYAVFINKENKLVFSSIFDRGGDWAERIITFDKIKDNVLYGLEVPNNNFPDLDTIAVNYIYKDKDLIQISK